MWSQAGRLTGYSQTFQQLMVVVRNECRSYFALRGLLQGGAMYFIWILIGMPIASLLCAAFIAMRDGKVRPTNTGVHSTQSVSSITSPYKATNKANGKSESAGEVLIGILGRPSDHGFKVTYVAKRDDKPWTQS